MHKLRGVCCAREEALKHGVGGCYSVHVLSRDAVPGIIDFEDGHRPSEVKWAMFTGGNPGVEVSVEH